MAVCWTAWSLARADCASIHLRRAVDLVSRTCFCIHERRKITLRKYYFLATAVLLIAAIATAGFAAVVSKTIQRKTTDAAGTVVHDNCLRSTDMVNWNGGNAYGNGAARFLPDTGFPSGKGPRHELLWFDLSGTGIAPGTTITSATMGVYLTQYNGGTTITGFKISRLNPLTTWLEGNGGDGDNPPAPAPGVTTWNQRQYGAPGVAWGTAGATGAADIDQSTSLSWNITAGSGSGFRTFDITSFTQAWINGTWVNNGVLIWGGAGTGSGNYYYMTTSEDPDAPANRPYLTIVWNDGAPVITAPIGGAFVGTLTPTITWTSNATGTVTNHQVRICTTDDPSTAVAKDSGTIAGNSPSWVSSSLTNGADYWAFAREQTASGWSPWSPVGNGGFHVSVVAPAAPTVTDPTGSSASPKVTVVFTGQAHTALQAKIFTSNVSNPETATAVFDSTVVTSGAFTCPAGMLANGSYWAFAKIQNAAGWSQWSAGHAFSVARADWVDVLQMDPIIPGTSLSTLVEDNPGGTVAWTGTALTTPDRQDGFGHEMLGGTQNTWSIANESGACGATSSNKLLVVENHGGTTLCDRSLRMHKCWDEIDLDRGVTFMWEMSCENEVKGALHGGKPLTCGTVLLSDRDASGVSHGVSVRVRANSVGIVSDQILASTYVNEPGGFTLASLPSSPEFRRFRLVGRNQIAGDYSSTVWKVYVNDVLTLTSTGSYVDPDNTYACDFFAVGVGESNMLAGKWSFDWTGINGGGDYGPGEWDPIPASQSTFASIGAAKTGLVGSRAVTINGSMVITKVISHLDLGPDLTPGTPDDTIVQDCYYVQDLTNGLLGSAVRAVTADTQSGAVAVGKQISHLTGVFAESGGCRSLMNASATISSADPIAIQGTAMSQKTLMSPCVSQGLGSNMDTSGMLVKVYGRVPTAPTYVGGDVFPPFGAYVVYVDDGSGAIDGREMSDGVPYPGIRVLIDASDPAAVIPSFGDYLMLEGIAGYENITTGAYPTVRQIMYPTITVVANGV